jgi:DNA recombination protein RmuC
MRTTVIATDAYPLLVAALATLSLLLAVFAIARHRTATAATQTAATLERELGLELRALQERLATATALAGERSDQLLALQARLDSIERQQEERQRLIAELSQRVGQSEQQARQLAESKGNCQELQTALRDAHEQLKRQSELLGQAREQKQRLEQSYATCQRLESDLKAERDALAAARARFAELSSRREQELQHAQEKIDLLQHNKEAMKQEFQNLANQIFDGKQQSFGEQSRQNLDALLKPFKEQLESFRHRVDQVHSETVTGQGAMKSELAKLMELNARITTEAANLTRALKGDKKLQGSWGEQKVELLLEQAGLRKGIEYEREPNFKDDDAQNRRPDFVVQLPEGKHIIIDSKVSLVDFTAYIAAETDEERAAALAAHVNALRAHIDNLAGKKYPELTGMNSPDFVFLFVPVEPAYLLAAEHSPALFQHAYEKRIAVVTATTLLPVLRVVANLWTIQRQNANTRQLADQAARVYDKLRVFVEKMEKLGGQIATVQKSYTDTFDTLHDGRGSLTKTVDRFVELGVKVVKRLPPSVAATAEDGLENGDSEPLLTQEEPIA